MIDPIVMPATEYIPAIGVAPDDIFAIRPAHDDECPLLVVKEFDRTDVYDWFVLTHSARCHLVKGSRRMLVCASSCLPPPHHLRVVP